MAEIIRPAPWFPEAHATIQAFSSATGTGLIPLVTPTKRFVLVNLVLSVSPTCQMTVAGAETFSIKDGATTIFEWLIYAPAAGFTNVQTGLNVNLTGINYVSKAVGAVLGFQLGTALTAGGGYITVHTAETDIPG